MTAGRVIVGTLALGFARYVDSYLTSMDSGLELAGMTEENGFRLTASRNDGVDVCSDDIAHRLAIMPPDPLPRF
jgi:hypothetical protein